MLALQWTDLGLTARKIRVKQASSDGAFNSVKSGPIQLTVDTYGKWLPMESHAAVDRLDVLILESGGRSQRGTC